MEEPDEQAVEEPVHSEKDAREANAWATKELTSIAVISIAALLLVALGMMQFSGLVELSPIGGAGGEIAVFGLLALVVAGLFAWSRRGV